MNLARRAAVDAAAFKTDATEVRMFLAKPSYFAEFSVEVLTIREKC